MGVSTLGATFAISLMVISQLTFATIIDTLGLFGMDKVPFDLTKLMGLAIMVIGLVVFKLKG
jgi:transporter family-2 protein